MTHNTLRVISYGGGVQSTAMIVLAVEGLIHADAALFANVGDDSEHPATLTYVRDVMTPWAAERGLPVHELHPKPQRKDNRVQTLWQQLVDDENDRLSISIPVYMSTGQPGIRSCTREYKVAVLARWLKDHGASRETPADVLIGISTDEFHRASTKRAQSYERPVFPLLALGIDRAECQRIIQRAGLPIPGKSSCYFCPYKRTQQWAEMARDEPQLFAQAADLEASLIRRRQARGKDPVYLTRFGRPLREAVGAAQDMLPLFDSSPDADTCDEGHCWT